MLSVNAFVSIVAGIRHYVAQVAQLGLHRYSAFDGLQHHAVSLTQLNQLVYLRLVLFIDIKSYDEPDGLEAHWHRIAFGILNAHRAPEIEIAFRSDCSIVDRDAQACCNRPHRDTETCDQRFEQHISGAEFT